MAAKSSSDFRAYPCARLLKAASRTSVSLWYELLKALSRWDQMVCK